MNQHDLIESAQAQLSRAHGALSSARQPALATRAGQTGEILLGDAPDAAGARRQVQALDRALLPLLEKRAPPGELQHALSALRAADRHLTAALGAQHRTEG